MEVWIDLCGGNKMVAGILFGAKVSSIICWVLRQICSIFGRVELTDSSGSGEFDHGGLEAKKSVAD